MFLNSISKMYKAVLHVKTSRKSLINCVRNQTVLELQGIEVARKT